jgi:hypothetical protein
MIRNSNSMSWLFIDTSERMRIRLAMIPSQGKIRQREILGRRPIVTMLASFIKAESIPSLDGIVVISGPGSFSAVRSGVLVANLLARMYHVPLYGVRVEDVRELEGLRDSLIANRLKPVSYVAPIYDQEPNITCPSR